MRAIGRGKVAVINDIDIEVQEETAGGSFQRGGGILHSLLRIASDILGRKNVDWASLDKLPLRRVEPTRAGIDSKEDDLLLCEQREPRANPGQSLGAVPEQMGHAHPVEDARRGGLRRIHVDIPIQVEKSEVPVLSKEARHHAYRDRAISAQDKDFVGTRPRFEGCAHVFNDAPYARQAPRRWMIRVWQKSRRLKVSHVDQRDAYAGQVPDEASFPQHRGRALLAGMVGSRARWDS